MRYLFHINGQIPFLHQTVKNPSSRGFRELQNLLGVLNGDFGIGAGLVHAFQKVLFLGGQLVLSQGGIHEAALKGIQHIGYEGAEIQPGSAMIIEYLLRVRQAAVVAAELLVDGGGCYLSSTLQ